jgi:thioredoxin 2
MSDGAAPLQVVCPQCDAVNRVPGARVREHPRCGKCATDLFTGHPLLLTPANFDTHISRSSVPVLVDFWAPWCAPCRAMAPAFEQAAQVMEPSLRFGKLNTDDASAIASRFNIRSIPTLILFRQGQERARQAGALSGPALMAWIREHVAHT